MNKIEDMLTLRMMNKCPFCAKDMKEAKFKDQLSKREFIISGICQECQDETFE